MKKLLKSIPKPMFKSGWLVILLIVIVSLTWRPLRILSLQARAGERIEKYIETHAGAYQNYFFCQIPALVDLPEDEALDKAVSLLEKARGLNLQNAQTNLLLGKAACLQGDYLKAVGAFEGFSQAKPDNQLGNLETAFAHFTYSLMGSALTQGEQVMHAEQGRWILEDIGIHQNYLINQGDTAIGEGEYQIAWYWYKIGETFSELTNEQTFRKTLLDIIYLDHKPDEYDFVEQYIYTFNKNSFISPRSLFRISDGLPVNSWEIENRLTGLFFSNNDPGGVLINFQNEGVYCFSIFALDRPPKPTNIKFSVDFDQLMMIELTEGDNDWKMYESSKYLEDGLHFLGFQLTNDAKVNGIDRNGHIGDIEIQYCQE